MRTERCSKWWFILLLIALRAFGPAVDSCLGQPAAGETSFEITGFAVEGNTLFTERRVNDLLEPFLGKGKTAADVEKARDALEKVFHEEGYPTILVNIPEQTVAQGIVKLQVIEGAIGRVRVTGNRYYTRDRVLRDLPTFKKGEILYLPDIQKELTKANANPDMKVSPLLTPGKEPGTVDVELKVEDKLPLHGSLELNNRYSPDTTHLRLNAMLRYDNLWQKDHSVSVQFQTSPEDTEQVKLFAGSYVFPAPWNNEHRIAIYGVWSDSNTAFGEGFEVIGSGKIAGIRYVFPLPPHNQYFHNLTLGIDYKDFDEATGFTNASGETTTTPITYVPVSVAYGSYLQDGYGATQFSAGLNFSIRGIVADEEEFATKRFQGDSSYLYLTAGVERLQKLPADFGIFVKLDGQLSGDPLVSNEQFAAGGMESVRGYKESEVLGDSAFHGTLEFLLPELASRFGWGERFRITPYAFFDFAFLNINEALPGQDESIEIQGTGAGVRGQIFKYFEYQVDWALALASTSKTEQGDNRFHFRLKYQF